MAPCAEIKLLGVTIDDRLMLDVHIDVVCKCKKVRSGIFVLRSLWKMVKYQSVLRYHTLFFINYSFALSYRVMRTQDPKLPLDCRN